MGGVLAEKPPTSYFFCQSDGNWWWEVNYEWWYFNEEGNEPTKWPHALLQIVWVNADNCEDWCGPIPPTYEEWEAQGWEEHGTSIVNHCLYFELGRLEEVASLAGPSNSTCPLPQGKRN